MLLFGYKNNHEVVVNNTYINIDIGNEPLQVVNQARNLGVISDSDLAIRQTHE